MRISSVVLAGLALLGVASCGHGDAGPNAASVKALLLPGLPELPARGVCDEQQPAEIDPSLITGQVAGITIDCEPTTRGAGQDLQYLVVLEFQDADEATSKAAALMTSLLGTQDSPGNAATSFERQELVEDVPPSTGCLVTADKQSAACSFAQGRFLTLVQGENSSQADQAAPQRVVAVLARWMERS